MITSFRPSLTEALLGLFFPPRCLACGEAAPLGQLFCPLCRARLPKDYCRRSLELEEGGPLPVVSVLAYDAGFRKTLHQLKFQGQKALARPIALLMAEAAGAHGQAFDCVAYVSMYPKDRRGRGFDHSRLLAKHTAAQLGLPLSDALVKVRKTKTQHELDRGERQKNLRGAYQCREDMTGRAVLLVDDIVTTGGSLTECARALKAAGAARVCALCAADTPLKPKHH